MSWETPEPNDLGWTAEDFREAYEARSGQPLPPLTPEEEEDLARVARITPEERRAQLEEVYQLFLEMHGPDNPPRWKP